MFNTIGLKIALGSFGTGVSILILYILTRNLSFVYVGYVYLFVAIILNVITLLYLLYDAFTKQKNIVPNIYTALIMILNIPIAFLCAYIGINYLP